MACTCDLSGCCWPTRAYQQHQYICVMGQSENFLGSHLDNLCRPMRHSHAAAHIVFNRPMRTNCEKHTVSEWAHARVCTCSLSDYCWPTQAYQQHQCICVMGQSENSVGSHLDNLCRPMQHSQAAVHIMLDGPMRANCKRPMVSE